MGKTTTQKVKALKQRFALIENELKIAKQQLEHILPVDAVVVNFLPDAVKQVTKAIKSDPELYYGYQSNIAMAFIDMIDTSIAEYKMRFGEPKENHSIQNKNHLSIMNRDSIHFIANQAAKNFLDMWCKQ